MKTFTPRPCAFLVLAMPLACGRTDADELGSDRGEAPDFGSAIEAPDSTGTLQTGQSQPLFIGAGTSGASRPLTAALPPGSSGQCDPVASGALPEAVADVQTVCFFSGDDPDVPAAAIEQVVEVVGNSEWVHLRLTLNPDFVDNTFGTHAIGWGEADENAALITPPGDAPPLTGAPAAGGPPAAAEPGNRRERDRPAPAGPGNRGKAGHTFKDLVGSDHAEIELLDADGDVAVHFRIDYISESPDAASGFASFGVLGGEGRLIVGEPAWVLAATTSLDRNLNACGLSAFTDSSPLTDAAYTPDPDASDWDFRVSYEVWVSTAAFGAAGFGSALIENVHASPSKQPGDTVDVTPAPCPVEPGNPGALPEPVPAVLQNIR